MHYYPSLYGALVLGFASKYCTRVWHGWMRMRGTSISKVSSWEVALGYDGFSWLKEGATTMIFPLIHDDSRCKCSSSSTTWLKMVPYLGFHLERRHTCSKDDMDVAPWLYMSSSIDEGMTYHYTTWLGNGSCPRVWSLMVLMLLA